MDRAGRFFRVDQQIQALSRPDLQAAADELLDRLRAHPAPARQRRRRAAGRAHPHRPRLGTPACRARPAARGQTRQCGPHNMLARLSPGARSRHRIPRLTSRFDPTWLCRAGLSARHGHDEVLRRDPLTITKARIEGFAAVMPSCVGRGRPGVAGQRAAASLRGLPERSHGRSGGPRVQGSGGPRVRGAGSTGRAALRQRHPMALKALPEGGVLRRVLRRAGTGRRRGRRRTGAAAGHGQGRGQHDGPEHARPGRPARNAVVQTGQQCLPH